MMPTFETSTWNRSSEDSSVKRIRREQVDITIMLDFTPCNYRCFYCCAEGVNKKVLNLKNVSESYLRFIDSFDAPEKNVRLNAYGELSLIPGIWEFLSEVARRAKVMLATNLTFDPQKLYSSIPPESALFLLTSMHPETEESLDLFVAKCQELLARGYEVVVHYIVDNDRIEEAKRYTELMKRWEIPFFVSPMQGRVREKSYPTDFTKETEAYLGDTLEELHPQLFVRYHQLAFTGLTCRAGYDMFCVRGHAITACMNSDELLGWVDGPFHPLPASAPCRATHANSQCLPDAFSKSCRSYCMGNHRIETSVASLQPHLDEFDRLYREVVRPSRSALLSSILEDFRMQLGGVASEASVAFFGVPFWPYLSILREELSLSKLILPYPSSKVYEKYEVVTPQQYLEQCAGTEEIVVLVSIHQANEARSFVEALRLSKTQALVIGNLPAHLESWEARKIESQNFAVDRTLLTITR